MARRHRVLLSTLVAATAAATISSLPTVALADATTAPARSSQAALCLPGASFCTSIIGSPGSYRIWFRFQPPPSWFSPTFTVNDTRVTGSLHYRSTSSYLEGTFTPRPALVSGDKVCMNNPSSGTRCNTVP